jgi:rRNA processing protein Gar1
VSAPELGSAVFDKDRNRIGSVKRVLGPVDGPYASVSGDGVSGSLKGAKVYSGQGGNNGRNRGKGRKH